ncbi:hypothetical protein H2204_010410 [Knufia peltigerae]|uniref:Uncharacterized protein n=1 Tax=Knufia peltigerae TaxID=1002370 RepID=A0AA38XX96_9EURO|nr:hypothetical protein H2204_010410 [Knufia peltigerae]
MIPAPHPASPEFQQLPSWARKLLNRPLVEIRRGLSFDYDPPTENHSVVVLTAPSGRYVDVRFASGSKDDRYEGIKKSDGFNGFATAGLSTSWLPGGTDSCPEYDCVAHVKWEHPIDSSREFGVDGADMYLLSNGDVMEVGFLTVKGKTKMFKEYWLGAKLSSSEPSFLVVETAKEQHNPDSGGNGLIMRIDGYCQGILQTDTEFYAERWQFQQVNGGRWAKDPKSTSGAEKLPCEWAMAATTKLGDSIVFGGRTWRVVESDKS